ncbi:hypothetical protein M378DRAFT_1038479 [Amanita muscaria Koide BX008]|uniref:Uncharacterized protein n=1 Tax=Amanita muscaria (strain Koide BX008) TaxID=946122 RepID=A0A0C2SQQ1_AMAMK|nr:hypothetical protein M378DRAFT_1038479 [Amanita muscaria Koide BX008]
MNSVSAVLFTPGACDTDIFHPHLTNISRHQFGIAHLLGSSAHNKDLLSKRLSLHSHCSKDSLDSLGSPSTSKKKVRWNPTMRSRETDAQPSGLTPSEYDQCLLTKRKAICAEV